jgi:hypothetical protein
MVFIFFAVLTIGFVYELGTGALKSMLPVSRTSVSTRTDSLS